MIQAGLNNVEVLKAATIINATILGVDKVVGSIETGKYADFVLIEGNPLTDISCVRAVRQVIKGGVAYEGGKEINQV